MTSTDLAAARQRVEARRQFIASQAQTRLQSRRSSQAFNAVHRLPFPLNGLGTRGIEVWDFVKGREGTKPALRVGQVDAELLDEELLELFKGQVGEALKYFGSHLRDEWSPEILLSLRAVLFKFTIWDHNASYGAALQNLRYTDARCQGPILATPSKWQKALYGLFTVGGRYGWEKWENWLVDQEGGYEEPIINVRLLSRLSSIASTTHSIAAFASFLIFLLNGRYRTLTDRILRLRLAPPTSQAGREVSFEYLNRQLVWHAFTEFLLFLLPLVGISRWRRWLSRGLRKAKALVRSTGAEEDNDSTAKGELAFLPERTCAICYQDQNPSSTSENEMLAVSGASGGVIGSAQTDATNPYETIPCRCIYCFVCLATRLDGEEGEGWICLRCGELVKECRPWAADVLEEASTSGTRKKVSFSDDEGRFDEQEKGQGPANETETRESITTHNAASASDKKAEGLLADGLADSQEWARGPGSDV